MTLTINDLIKWFSITEAYTVVRAQNHNSAPYLDIEVYQPGARVLLYVPNDFYDKGSNRDILSLPHKEVGGYPSEPLVVEPVRMPHAPVHALGEDAIALKGISEKVSIIIFKGIQSIDEQRYLSLVELGLNKTDAVFLSAEKKADKS